MFADDGPDGLVAEAFDQVRRFHVYDHARDEWVMSGAQFSDEAGCVIEHNYEPGELTKFSHPETVVSADDDMTLVWEDGEDCSLEGDIVDLETAEVAARAVIDGLADRLEVERDRIRVVSLRAPNQVRYFVTAPVPEGPDR